MRIRHLIIAAFQVFLLSAFCQPASAAAPAAPSNLKVTPLGVNSFRVEWKDNSTNEVGFEIRVGLKSSSKKNPPHFSFITIPVPATTGGTLSQVIVTNVLTGKALDFQVAAYNGVALKEVFSTPTSIVTVNALSSNKFGAPTKLATKLVDDSQVRFTWVDNATAEYGYLIESKKGNGKWSLLTRVSPDTKFDLPLFGFDSGTTYSFRVRAFKENPVVFSAYSNTITVPIKTFQAPSNLTATPSGEDRFIFKWKDTSSLEEGIEIESKPPGGEFGQLLTASGSNFTGLDPFPAAAQQGFSRDADFQFRMRFVRMVGTAKVYSPYSSVITARSAVLRPPTELAGETVDDTSVKLTWKDKSSLESGFQIQFREQGKTDYEVVGNLGSNIQTTPVYELESGKRYEFRVRAYDLTSYSAFSPTFLVSTKNGVTSDPKPPVTLAGAFDYLVEVSDPTNIQSLLVTGLPPGFAYNSETHRITGSINRETISGITIEATYKDGHKSTRVLTLQVKRAAPTVAEAFAAVNVPVSTNKTVSVVGKFTDPDVSSAARFVTSKGTFDVILFPTITPITVDNFIDYIDAGEYNNSYFHRAPSDFVVQGGGYKYTTENGFSRVTTFAQITNEPRLSSVRGTIAMAKLGGQPNSATSQFFVNLSDLNGYNPDNSNGPNLDTQNGGFTVFGRVPTSGMAVIEMINKLPKGNYDIPGESFTFESVPINAASAPETLDPSQLVKITSAGAAPILSYSVTSAKPSVATASLSGNDITITGVAAGTTTVQVTATDLDGKTVSQNIAVTVP